MRPIFSLLLLQRAARSASAAQPPAKNLRRCLEDGEYDPSVDYFPQKASGGLSRQWSVEYHNSYKVLTNKDAEMSYLLYQCGSEPPEGAEADHHLVVPVPLRGGVVVTQTTQIPHLELLGLRREIKAYVGSRKYVSSPCVDRMVEEGTAENLDGPGVPWNATVTVPLMDEFLDRNPEAVVLTSPWSDKGGRNALVVSESKEDDNEAIFGWHEYYAVLYNMEGEGAKTVEETSDRYNCHADNAAALSRGGKKPKVLWAYYSATHEAWDVADCPGNYYCEYADHCHVDFLFHPEGVGSVKDDFYGTVYMTDEEFLAHGKDADHWIVPASDWNTLYAEKKDLLDQFESVKNNRVFDNQGKGPNAWFEQRLAEYDVVLLDFCDVAGMAPPGQEARRRRWFRNVFTEAVGDLGTCPLGDAAIDERYETGATECVRSGGRHASSWERGARTAVGAAAMVMAAVFL